MIGIPTGPSLIIHGLVVATAKFFPSFLIKYKKISAGYFGFVFVIFYLGFIGLLVMLIFYHLFTSQNNISYVNKIIAGPQHTSIKLVASHQVIPDMAPMPQIQVIDYQVSLAGATNVSTGLTDNPLTDSFFIPLILVIIGIWAFKRRKVLTYIR